jgi:TonB family protein
MRHHPISPVTEPMQYRAIGVVRGTYRPSDPEQLTRGVIETEDGTAIEAVVLGRVLTLMRRHLDLAEPHLWVVYPRSRDEDQLHLQLVGVWEPSNGRARVKVERIGNLNYPESARRQGIYVSLKLTVTIHANGQIEAVEIDRSSGSKILDAAAVRIVELAAFGEHGLLEQYGRPVVELGFLVLEAQHHWMLRVDFENRLGAGRFLPGRLEDAR